jgi:NAD(P)-dependent dehydrogenase (short-subunit alcohol dehydrogenase family)
MTAKDTNRAQTVLITGASTGFGNLTTKRLLKGGYRVFASMRDPQGRNAEHAQALRSAAAAAPGELTVLDIDVTDGASVEKGIAAALEAAGQVDVLINNAGQAYMGPFEAFSDEQVRRQFDVNFFGAASMIRGVMPSMRGQGSGLIVNVSSGLGRTVFPGTGLYSASKYAMEAMSEAIRFEASGHGIDSVTVEPGAYQTEIAGRFVDPERKAEAAAYGPLADTGAMWQESLDAYFATGGGNPAEVVDAIVNLIEAKPDERPARVAVGADVGFVSKMNEAALPGQREGLEAFGMQDFLPLVR